jgi:HTH-type transcriptional regulator/antitoxin HipB
MKTITPAHDPLAMPLTVLPRSSYVGRLLHARRKQLGLTQAQLALRLGISQNRLSDLERRPKDISLDRILEWTRALGLVLFTCSDREPCASAADRAKSATPDDEAW